MPKLKKINQMTYALALRSLLDGPVTVRELVEETGLSLNVARDFMNTLKKYKVVHVCAWEQNIQAKWIIPVYELGAGRDKPRPKMSKAEINQRHKLKKQMLAMTGALHERVEPNPRAVCPAPYPNDHPAEVAYD